MDRVELEAKAMWERATGRTLTVWDVPGRENAVDFRATTDPTVSVEVKRLTVEEFHAALGATGGMLGFTESGSLRLRWTIMLDLPTSSSSTPFPVVRDLASRTLPLIVHLEALGATSSRVPPSDPAVGMEFWRTVFEFERLTGGALAMGSPSNGGGIEFATGYGHVTRLDPNTVVEAIDRFLSSASSAANLLQKLKDSVDVERHAFLWATQAVSETWQMDRWTEAETLPTRRPEIPSSITELWLAGVGALWSFRDHAGWVSHSRRDRPLNQPPDARASSV